MLQCDTGSLCHTMQGVFCHMEGNIDLVCQTACKSLEQGTATIEVKVDVELLMQVEAVLRGYGWTVEEAMVLFAMWCIVCPDKLSTWCSKTKDGDSR